MCGNLYSQEAARILTEARVTAQSDLSSAKQQATSILVAAQEVGRHALETEEHSAFAVQQVDCPHDWYSALQT